MKKLMLFLFAIIPCKVFCISASSAIALDLDNGRMLYGYNIHEKRLIASTTKIMTAIIAIENGNLSDVIEITDVIYKSFGSSLYLEVGEKISLEDLLYGLILRSGNDAALVIANYISGSKEEFVYLMNEYAKNLKMNDSNFVNPSGLEENDGSGNISTAYDMALLTRYAMNNKEFRKIFKTKEYRVKTNFKSYYWISKNKLLKEKYITGGKTGYTKLAKRTLVSTGSKNDINVVVVTLNDSNDWEDHKRIYNSIFNEYNNIKVANKGFINSNKYYLKNDCFFTLKNDEFKKIKLNYNYYTYYSSYNGAKVGELQIIIDNKIYHKEPIYLNINKKKKKVKLW